MPYHELKEAGEDLQEFLRTYFDKKYWKKVKKLIKTVLNELGYGSYFDVDQDGLVFWNTRYYDDGNWQFHYDLGVGFPAPQTFIDTPDEWNAWLNRFNVSVDGYTKAELEKIENELIEKYNKLEQEIIEECEKRGLQSAIEGLEHLDYYIYSDEFYELPKDIRDKIEELWDKYGSALEEVAIKKDLIDHWDGRLYELISVLQE